MIASLAVLESHRIAHVACGWWQGEESSASGIASEVIMLHPHARVPCGTWCRPSCDCGGFYSWRLQINMATLPGICARRLGWLIAVCAVRISLFPDNRSRCAYMFCGTNMHQCDSGPVVQ